MSHPSACGVSADDVAVLVHDDLLAIGQGHGIAAIADAFQNTAAWPLAIKAHNGILEFRRDKFLCSWVFSFPHSQMVRVL